jgi:hypothetical protein
MSANARSCPYMHTKIILMVRFGSNDGLQLMGSAIRGVDFGMIRWGVWHARKPTSELVAASRCNLVRRSGLRGRPRMISGIADLTAPLPKLARLLAGSCNFDAFFHEPRRN